MVNQNKILLKKQDNRYILLGIFSALKLLLHGDVMWTCPILVQNF